MNIDAKLDEETYTLRSAAALLQIDFKTLKKRMEHAKITPIRDKVDQRVRLLTRDQVRQLATDYRRGASAPETDAALPRLIRTVKEIVNWRDLIDAAVTHLESAVADIGGKLHTLSRHVTDLQRQIKDIFARLSALEERLNALVTALAKSTDLEHKVRDLQRQLDEQAQDFQRQLDEQAHNRRAVETGAGG